MRHEHLLLALLVAATPVLAAPPQASPAAAAELSPVTVSGASATPPLRLDVRAACPAIDIALQRSLSSAWGWVQEPATLRVQFRVDGGRITEVWSTGSTWKYRPYVRRAVQQLDCGPSGAGMQEFAFMLEIVGDQAAGQEQVVVLSPRR